MSLQSYHLDPQREIIIGIDQPIKRMKKLQGAPVIASLRKTNNVKVFTVLPL